MNANNIKWNIENPAPPAIEEKTTYLYIIRNNRNGYFKIGKSINPKHREKTLQSEDPDITLLYIWHCENSIESKIHKKFRPNRKRGEWFEFADQEMVSVLSFINELIYQ